MSQWITDRLPTEADADYYCNVWNSQGHLVYWTDIEQHEAWCSTNCPGLYQSDKQNHMDYALRCLKQQDDMFYTAKNIESGLYSVHSLQRGQLCEGIASREEARKIAAAFAAFADEAQP